MVSFAANCLALRSYPPYMRNNTSYASLGNLKRSTSSLSEYQVCLWCATTLPTQQWACVDCRMRIKQSLHEQDVSFFAMDGQLLLSGYGPVPGSLTLKEVKFALSPSFHTHAHDLIQVTPLCNPCYPHELPFPEDLPVRILGAQLQAVFTGTLQQRNEFRMQSFHASKLQSAIIAALQSIRSVPHTYLLHLICESMRHYVL